jgi:curli biogenesis system outer membrane secretion channel CsgG
MNQSKAKISLLVGLVALLTASCTTQSRFSIGFPPEVPIEQRLIVAVPDLEGTPDAGNTSWEDALVTALIQTRRFRIIERSRLDALLDEHELSMSSLANPGAASRVFGLLGADAVLLVRVGEIREYSGLINNQITGWWSDVSLGVEVSVSARLVSTTSGEILVAASSSGQAESGTFSGALGISTVDKPRNTLIADALKSALTSLAYQLGRQAPVKH